MIFLRDGRPSNGASHAIISVTAGWNFRSRRTEVGSVDAAFGNRDIGSIASGMKTIGTACAITFTSTP